MDFGVELNKQLVAEGKAPLTKEEIASFNLAADKLRKDLLNDFGNYQKYIERFWVEFGDRVLSVKGRQILEDMFSA